jgi:DNA polymerase-3 subunit gamma/tau
MSYTVFARKYRPQTFKDLVGQEHVTRTLANAITSGRVAHAFLFTGVRGVGKTTSARILAKALNCESGPTPEPCNVCDACTQITQGMDLDVLEMDGASNNSVDDVRRLQESIPFRPARDRYKIVIVDEVHMLSSGAFNAFLKTLEEPPAHVKFIFATTEAHKVPVTIRSRCQRYDFRLIPQPVIVERIVQILRSEQIEADEHAVTIVAREAAGSMRDALTLLDQVVAFAGNRLDGQEVARHLGIADREHLYTLASAVLAGDGKSALEVIDTVAEQGLDLLHFTRQWLDLARDMVVLSVAGDHPKLVDLPAAERERALHVAKTTEALELQRAFSAIAALVEEVGLSGSPRVALEMGAVRLATRPPLRDLATLIARLEQSGSGGSPAPPSPQRAGSGPPASQAPRGRGPGSGSFADARHDAPSPASGRSPPADTRAPSNDTSGAHAFKHLIPPEASASERTSTLAPAPQTMVRASVAVQANAAHAAALQTNERPAERSISFAPPSARSSGAQLSVAPAPATRESTGLAERDRLWAKIVAHLRDHEPPPWAAMFEHGVPEAVDEARVIVTFGESTFFGRQAESTAGVTALTRAAHSVLGATATISVKLVPEVRGTTLAQLQASQLDERKDAIKRKALSHPRVLEAFKVFPELSTKQDVHIDPEQP